MSPKNWHQRTIAQLCRAISSQLRHESTIGKKFKQQYLLQMFSQYDELRSTNSWRQFGSLGRTSKFQWVLRLGFVTTPTSLNRRQPNFARCLATSWAGTLYIHFRRLLPRNGISPRPKFILRHLLGAPCINHLTYLLTYLHTYLLTCVLLCWQRYCTALE